MNGIANITIGGNPVRLKFGLPAVRRIFEKMSDIKLMEGDAYTEEGICLIVHSGYLNGCIQRDEVPAVPFEVFYDYVEDFRADRTNEQEVRAALKSFEDSRFIKKVTTRTDGEDEKKSPSIGRK